MPNNQSERNLKACCFAMTTALVFGMIDTIYSYGIKLNIDLGIINSLYEILPLSSEKLAWVPWTILAAIIGYFVFRTDKHKIGEVVN